MAHVNRPCRTSVILDLVTTIKVKTSPKFYILLGNIYFYGRNSPYIVFH